MSMRRLGTAYLAHKPHVTPQDLLAVLCSNDPNAVVAQEGLLADPKKEAERARLKEQVSRLEGAVGQLREVVPAR
jgi:hypothetical protein